jgi:hypothetical protein
VKHFAKVFFTTLLVLGLVGGTAAAATRTVCVNLRLKDNRDGNQCAQTWESGSKRGCSPGGDVNHRGAIIELWDKDPDGSDERIGSWSYWFEGGSCMTFEWDSNGTANAEHEANPDVYAVFINQVFGPQASRSVTALKQDGTGHPAVSWRNGEAGAPDRYVANECTTAGACWIFPGGYLLPAGDVTTTAAKISMALDSAQHALETFSGIMTLNVNMRMPDTTCPTGCVDGSAWRTLVHIPDNLMTDGVLVAHEMSHTVEAQRFGINTLRDDCSANGAGWNMTSSEFDSCSTTEGFATYGGIVSWYDPDNTATNPIGWGLNFESATPQDNGTCANNRAFAVQVARAFWDFDDVNNEAGVGVAAGSNDREGWVTTDVAVAWDRFAPGTANRQSFENSSNGVNVQDYRANTNSFFGNSPTMTETILNHNCLQSQAP